MARVSASGTELQLTAARGFPGSPAAVAVETYADVRGVEGERVFRLVIRFHVLSSIP